MKATKINMENHEAYFLDYLEGRLNVQNISELELFLAEHPELKDKLELFDQVTIDKTSYIYPDKDSLKKFEFNTASINKNNFADFCIAFHEGILGVEKEKELLEYIALNSEYSDDFQYFKQAYLIPQKDIVFPDKKILLKLKHAENYRIIAKWLSIAASVAILLTVYISFLHNYRSARQTGQYFKETLNSIPSHYQKKAGSFSMKTDKHRTLKINVISNINQNNNLNKVKLTCEVIQTKYLDELSLIEPIVTNNLENYNEKILSNSLEGQFIFYDFRKEDFKEPLIQSALEKITKIKLAELKNKHGKLSVIKIAQVGLDGMNRIFNSNMRLTEKTDSKGNVIALSFESEAFEYHRSRRVKDNTFE